MGSFIVASVLSISFSSVASEASEWNQSSIKTEQSKEGWEKMMEIKRTKMDAFKNEFKGAASSLQRHSVNMRSHQLQNGQSKGEATATQSSELNMDVDSKLTTDSTELKQETKGSGLMEQSTKTEDVATVLQSQSNTTSVYHFQASIEGGPSLQNQMVQVHAFQFSSVFERDRGSLSQ